MINMSLQHNYASEIGNTIMQHPILRPVLEAIRDLEQDHMAPCKLYVAGGSIATAVWNRKYDCLATYGLKDVDILYYAPGFTRENEQKFEQLIKERIKVNAKLDVKNQASMPERIKQKYGIEILGYESVDDSCRKWSITATSITVRLEDDTLRIHAPYGLSELHNGIIAPAPLNEPPYFIGRQGYEYKVETSIRRWPKLEVMPYDMNVKPKPMPCEYFTVPIAQEPVDTVEIPCGIGDIVLLRTNQADDTDSFPYIETEVRDYQHFYSCGFCAVVTSNKTGKMFVPFKDFGKTAFLKPKHTRKDNES